MIPDRLLVLLQRLICISTIAIRIGIGRIQANRFRIIFDGLLVLLQVIIFISAIVIRKGILRIQANGFRVIPDRLLVLLQVIICISAIVIRRGILRIQSDCFRVIPNGLLVSSWFCRLRIITAIEPINRRHSFLIPPRRRINLLLLLLRRRFRIRGFELFVFLPELLHLLAERFVLALQFRPFLRIFAAHLQHFVDLHRIDIGLDMANDFDTFPAHIVEGIRLVHPAQHSAREREDFILCQGAVHGFRIRLDVDARLLGRHAQRVILRTHFRDFLRFLKPVAHRI